MKKVNFKHVFLMLSFAVAFLFLGVERVEAQAVNEFNLSSMLYSAPQGSFVNANTAKTLLDSQLQTLKSQLENNLTPGTQAYKLAEGRYTYYSTITMLLDYSPAVSRAIGGGLSEVQRQHPAVTDSELLQLKQDAVGILKI
jgi:hypothetical protein